MDDAELVRRASRGDEEAWRAIWDRHGAVVRRVLAVFDALSSADAEELVQETFVHALEQVGRLREPERLRAWLLAIARSRALKRLRSRGAETRALGAFGDDPALGPVVQGVPAPVLLDEARRAALVREVVSALPAGPERETVELFYVDGTLSAREIAERLGVGKSAVTMRLERFRAKVKQRLAAVLAADEEWS